MLWIILLVRAVFLALFIINGPFSLGPDEAQYWTWSQDLSFGYYSKPPGISWQIFLTTLFAGNAEWGVRLSALIMGTLLPIALYWSALKGGFGKQVAFWSALTMALVPIDIIGSILALTDGGMLLFWTLAMGVFLGALSADKSPSPWSLGGFIALGAIFKWPIFILLGVILFYTFLYQPSWRKDVLKGAAISLLGLLPSFVWNVLHGFATFRHVGATLVGGHDDPNASKGNFLDFFGAQGALFSPLIYIFFWWAIYRIVKRERTITPTVYFLFLLSITILAPLFMSLFEKMQGNWGDFIYPSAILLTVEDLLSRKWKGWLVGSILLSVVLSFGFLTIAEKVPFRKNPFKNTLGWRNLKGALESVNYDPEKQTLIGETYQMASLLSFYGPGQKRGYFVNLSGRRHNQFDYWSPLENDPRKEGIFVASDVALDPLEAKLKSRFSDVQYLGERPLWNDDRKAYLFRVKGYTPKVENVGLF